jgi:hypothetical protein
MALHKCTGNSGRVLLTSAATLSAAICTKPLGAARLESCRDRTTGAVRCRPENGRPKARAGGRPLQALRLGPLRLTRPRRVPQPWLQHAPTLRRLPSLCLQPCPSHRTGHRRRRAFGVSSRQLQLQTLESRRRCRHLGHARRHPPASRTRCARRQLRPGHQTQGERGWQEQLKVGALAPTPPPPRAWGQTPPRAACSTAACPPRAALRRRRPPSCRRHWHPFPRTHAAAGRRTRCRRATRPR